ncbi:MAG: oxidoreductase [Bacteroides sp. SM23_62_1]|nr:MAG: oxidoreductase [Bacteroides sp. SM23_62_1]
MRKNIKPNKPKGKRITRRAFLGTAGAATAAFTIIPRHVMARSGRTAPSDMVNVAGIGVGSQGGGDIQQIATPDVPIVRPQRSMTGMPLTPEQIAEQQARMAEMIQRMIDEGYEFPEGFDPNAPFQMGAAGGEEIRLANIYALCDVDSDYAGYVFKGYPKAKIYTDWREMLEKETSIDAIVIGTPDHNHAPIAAAFIKEKKHVYIEKPMAKTIYECRRLAELAKEYDVVTQMGNQGHALEGTRRTVEWVQGGVIGPVREVHLSTNRPIWPQGNISRPTGIAVPDHLDWDLWIGPAPMKDYHPEICHFNWRGLWDYGTGAMGDMGAHIFDAPIWALKLDYPTRIQAASTPFSDDYLPQAETIIYEFAARSDMPPVIIKWCDGGLRPERPVALEAGRAVMDAIYYGDKGIMMHGSHGAMPQLVPADKDFTGPDPWLPRTGNIFEDWINAIKEGKKSSNDFSVAAKLTEIMLLTNIAVLSQQSNTTLEYDARNMKITNLPEANDLFHYEYRQGWTL